jgi:hypothetical protein
VEGPGGLKRVQQLLAAAQECRRTLRRTPVPLEATTFDRLRQEVASAMEQAVREEERNGDRNYPPDIVEVSPLAYAWMIADHVTELYTAFTDLLPPEPPRPVRPSADCSRRTPPS